MAHSLLPLPATAAHTARTPKIALLIPRALGQRSCNILPLEVKCGNRRAFMYGLIAAGAASLLAPDIASAAKRRPPPPQTEEKTDPNISGVQAKVLASKKRKEAMKEAVAKLREKGKAIK